MEANFASAGTAESFVKATSVTRSRRTHQVTASSLYVLLKKAYTKYRGSLNDEDDILLFDDRVHPTCFSSTAVPVLVYNLAA